MSFAYCKENDIVLYIYPPHCSHLYQPLDQEFSDWHTAYKTLFARWKSEQKRRRKLLHAPTPGRSEAVELMLRVIIRGWLSNPQLRKGWKNTGYTDTGYNKFLIPESKLLPDEEHGSEEMRSFIKSKKRRRLSDQYPADFKTRVPGESEKAHLKRQIAALMTIGNRLLNEPVPARELGSLEIPLDGLEDAQANKKKRWTIMGPMNGTQEEQVALEAQWVAKSEAERVAGEKANMELSTRYLLHATKFHDDVGAKAKAEVYKAFAKQNCDNGICTWNKKQPAKNTKTLFVKEIHDWMLEQDGGDAEETVFSIPDKPGFPVQQPKETDVGFDLRKTAFAVQYLKDKGMVAAVNPPAPAATAATAAAPTGAN